MSKLVLTGPVSDYRGWWTKTISPEEVKEFLDSNDGDIEVEISSYGGSFYAGMQIFNLLREYAKNKGKVTTIATAKAMSAASHIFLAGDERKAYSNTTIMCHCAWTYAYGNAHDMKRQERILDGIDGIQASLYKRFQKRDLAEIKSDMRDEMWYIGEQQLLESGFVTEVLESNEAPVSFNEAQSSFNSAKNDFLKVYAEHNSDIEIGFEEIENTIQSCAGNCTLNTPRETERPKDAVISNEGDFSMTQKEIEKLQADYAESQSTIEALNADLGNRDEKIQALENQVEEMKTSHATALKEQRDTATEVTKEAIHAGMQHEMSVEQIVEAAQAENIDKMNTKLMSFMQSKGGFYAGGGNPQGREEQPKAVDTQKVQGVLDA